MKKRILSLLLCCCLLAGVFQPQKARAVFVADDLAAAGGVALVASLLVAGGAAFSTNDDLQAVANDIYTRYIQPSAPLLEEVSGLVQAWYKGVASGVVCCANISTRLWAAICGDPVAENVASGYYGSKHSYTFSKAPYVNDLEDIRKELSASSPSRCFLGGSVFTLSVSGSSVSIYRDGVFLRNFLRNSLPSVYFIPYQISKNGVYYLSLLCSGVDISGSYQWWADLVSVSYPCTISFGSAISYPTDKDLIRPGEKSAVVQLPSDLPRYGEDGATVEMPVLGLTQEDYLITDSDVLSPDKVDEDVILDAKTGTKVGESSGEITEPTTPVVGNILDWLKSVLKGLLDAIIALLQAIRDGILSIPQAIAKAVAAIFCPTDEAIQAVQTDVATKLPLITDVKSILGNFGDLLKNPDKAASGLALTTIVDLGKHTGGGWSDAKINLLDASWFLPYKSLTDDIIVGLAWLVFLWNLYGQLPGIIHGSASDLSVTARTSREGDIRGS